MTDHPDETLATDLRFSIIPEWVLDAEVSDRAIRLYGVLARYADSDGTGAFPKRKTLADRLRVSVDSVDRALSELLDLGAVERQYRFSEERGQQSNRYYVRRIPPGRSDAAPSSEPHGCDDPDRTGAAPPGRSAAAHTENQPDREPPTEMKASEPDGSSSSPDVDEPVDEPTTTVAEEGWETARDLCEFLADAIVETGVPGTKRPNVTRAWVAEMERMIRLDERDPDHVRRAIEWAHRGPGSVGNGNGWAGWGAVVRSPSKLRAKYDQMAQQAESRRRGSNGKANGSGYTGDDFRRAAAALREQGR